jgi:uncharacterized phage protein gp47/JayE
VTFTGTPGTLIGVGFEVTTPQIDPDIDPVSVITTAAGTIAAGGSVDIAVQASLPGAEGNVAMGTLTVPNPQDGLDSTTNANALSGGADVEDDEAYRNRLLLEFSSVEGAGTLSDYQRWLLARPSIGFVSVEPIWAGVGTVRCVVMDPGNNPLSAAALAAEQTYIDPPVATTTLTSTALNAATITVGSTASFTTTGGFYVLGQRINYTGKTATTFTGCSQVLVDNKGNVLSPAPATTGAAGSPITQGGQGRGRAPIGADVLLVTGTLVNIVVAAAVNHRTGYTLDGTSGTQPTRANITAALTAYINELPPGEDVILNHVRAAFFNVDGVYDVTGLTLNGIATDKVLAPLEVAVLLIPVTLS